MERNYQALIVDETAGALIATSPKGLIEFWNRGATDLFGYSSEEAIGRSFLELTVPEDRLEAERMLLAETQRTGAGSSAEAVRRRKDGSLLYLTVTVRALRNGNGDVDCFVRNETDVTRLRLLRESQLIDARYRDVLESLPDATLILNNMGHIVLVNGRAEAVFGHARDELIGQQLEMLVPARFRSAHVQHRFAYFAQPRTREMGAGVELYGLRKTGEEFPAEISLSPLRTDEGMLVMSAIRDISDRKKAEQKFKGLLESAPDSMVIVDGSGRIVLVNTQAERMFGYARAELLGQLVDILIPERFQGRHPAHRTGYFADPKVRPMGAGLDLRGRRKDGSEFPVEISLSPLETEDGTLVSSSIRDITDRKRFEQALREKNIELERASQAKDRFLATMSHELRTPLNAIIGFTGTLLMQLPGPLTVDQDKQLRTVQASARHLLSLINDLLDLAKIESGKVHLDLQPVPVLEVVQEVCAALQPAAHKKGLAIELRLPCATVLACTDRRSLSQILINLTSNAIKFTERGTIRLEVTHERDDGAAGTQISVVDTGIGIRDEDQAGLFEAFGKLASGAHKTTESTGLGLYLSQKLAQLLGGKISLSSTHGLGSRFTLSLPE